MVEGRGFEPLTPCLSDGSPFVFAGFYSPGKEAKKFGILKTEPNTLLARVHERMRAIIRKENFVVYLRGEALEAS